jgi:alkanesulfonate monooxygenase SsuD/methylene tetrahydromethanopterin reductase-like flavin-dependent oxidoreductase (luciferase family)
VQKPHPPIWIGGESPRALKRAALLGDGWYPIGANPTYPLGTSEQLASKITTLRRYAEEGGRDPSEINIAYSAGWYDDQHAITLQNGERRSFTGTPEQIAGDIREFKDLGVSQMTLGLQADTLDQTVERMERFANDVMPLVGS